MMVRIFILILIACMLSGNVYSASVKIIYDNDDGSDTDDAAELALLNHLADCGEVDIVACTNFFIGTQFAQATEAAFVYYGRSVPPIGINPNTLGRTTASYWSGYAQAFYDWYATYIKDYFSVSTSSYDSALTIQRTALAAADNSSITMVFSAPMDNLYYLYNSPGDGISALTGAQLIAAKCKEIVVSYGDYPSMGTPYYGGDAITLQTNQVLNSLADTGVKVVYVGDTLGKSVTTDATSAPDGSYAHQALCYRNLQGQGFCKRYAWGAIAQLYAIRGLSYGSTTYFSYSPEGKISVAEDGTMTWITGDYNQYYLQGVMSAADLKTVLDGMINSAPNTNCDSCTVTPTHHSCGFRNGGIR